MLSLASLLYLQHNAQSPVYLWQACASMHKAVGVRPYWEQLVVRIYQQKEHIQAIMVAKSQRTHIEMVTVRTGIRKLTPARKQQQQGLCSHSEQKCLFPSRKISKSTGGWGERHAMNRKKKLFSQNSVIFYSGNNSSSLAKQKRITIFLNDLWTTKRKVIQNQEIVSSADLSCSFLQVRISTGEKDQLSFLHIFHWCCLIQLACRHCNT